MSYGRFCFPTTPTPLTGSSSHLPSPSYLSHPVTPLAPNTSWQSYPFQPLHSPVPETTSDVRANTGRKRKHRDNKENELPRRQDHEHPSLSKKQRSTSCEKRIQHPEEPINETPTKRTYTPYRTDAEKLDAALDALKAGSLGKVIPPRAKEGSCEIARITTIKRIKRSVLPIPIAIVANTSSPSKTWVMQLNTTVG